jgi:type 1 glutamine amidotransferase
MNAHAIQRFAAALLMLCTAGAAVPAEEPAQVLIVVGPSNHPPGTHEVAAGGRVLKHCLEHATNLPPMQVDLVSGWPSQAQRDAAQTVVFMGDTFPANRLPNVARNLADLEAMMARGCGIVCIHYATGLRGEDVSPEGDHPLLRWLGGYFANRTCPHHESFAKIFPEAVITPAAPQHPISSGWRAFTVHDEPYYNMYFGPGNKMPANVTPLATSLLPPEAPQRHTVAWCVERADGGRGFGIVMPHFFKNWRNDDLRCFIVNGIVWTARREVPSAGVQTTLPDLSVFQPEAVEPVAPPPRPPKAGKKS